MARGRGAAEHPQPTPYDAWARAFVRSLRGRRSARAFSAALGFRSDVVSRWESGARELTAADALRAMEAAGLGLRSGLLRFDEPLGAVVWAHSESLDERVSFLLRTLCESTETAALTRALGVSARTVERLLSGELRPRFASLLLVIDLTTSRAIDFVVALLGDRLSDELLVLTERRRAQVHVGIEYPLASAVLALLTSEPYRRARGDTVPWLSARLRRPATEVQQLLRELVARGLVAQEGERHTTNAIARVDIRVADPTRIASRFWAQEIARRVDDAPAPRTGFLVLGTSQANAQRVYQIVRQAYQDVANVLNDDVPSERVIVLTMTLCPLDGEELALV